MCACWWPQNSAHCPSNTPGRSACIQSDVACCGRRSFLPASRGAHRLWITSAERVLTSTGRPTGTWISLAVRTRSAGAESQYSTSHHHWCPVTSTVRASGLRRAGGHGTLGAPRLFGFANLHVIVPAGSRAAARLAAQRAHVGHELPRLRLGDAAAEGRHPVRPAPHDARVHVVRSDAVDPRGVHERRTHAAAAPAAVASVAVERLVETLALGDRPRRALGVARPRVREPPLLALARRGSQRRAKKGADRPPHRGGSAARGTP